MKKGLVRNVIRNSSLWEGVGGLSLLIILLFASCARMGQPDGGWYDETPPRVVNASPADKATGVKAKKIIINFNEYIKLEDPQNKVIVSPPQLEQPEIKAAGRRIIVELKDSLKENTTYTVDFGDAISDNNEGNPMGNFTYSFSTGERIDTFEVAGYVLDAENLEPIKGIQVGLYDDLSDTVFHHKPMVRISRTDSRGHFTIKGVAPGQYRCYALQDADGDFVYNQKSEMIAFSHDLIVPWSKPDIRQDTVWRDSLRIDSIARIPYTHFLPDDVTLLAFKQEQTDRYLLKTERKEANILSMFFSYGNDTLPVLRGLNFDADSAFVLEASAKLDTLNYWLRDTTLVNQDTLLVENRYLMTDSMGVLVWQTDTTEFLAKVSYEKRQKDRNKEIEKWLKAQEKKKKRGETYDSVYPTKPLELKLASGATMPPDKNVLLEVAVPLAKLDTSAVHLYSEIDSVWYESPFVFRPKEGSVRKFEVLAEWRPGIEYSLEIDSAAFVDIYGNAIKAFKQGIKIGSTEEYSSLVLTLSGVRDTGTVVVQLLSSSDAVVKEAVMASGQAEFYYLNAGTYFVRAFVDQNGNGKWDVGDFDADRQAEPVYYMPREIECKEKWDVTESWDLSRTARYLQKPAAVTKQKADKQKKQQNRNAERAKKMGIEYLNSKGVRL